MLGTGVLAVVNNCGIKKLRNLFARVNFHATQAVRTLDFAFERLHFKQLSPQENWK